MIKILVDSSSDITAEESKKLGIELIPMEVLIDGVAYHDGVDLSHEEFFRLLGESHSFPQTSQISEYRYHEKFEELTKNGDSLIVICLSSGLSSTYNQAVLASKDFENVYVVDSLTASIGEMVLIKYALRLVKKGLPVETIVEKLNSKKKKIRVFALMGTLKYLKKGGRISSLIALAGTVLNIKPIISFQDGLIKFAGKTIGFKKGISLLKDFVIKTNGIDLDMPYTVGYSCPDKETLDNFAAECKDLWNGDCDVSKRMIGSTIGAHIGPGAVAVSYFEKDN